MNAFGKESDQVARDERHFSEFGRGEIAGETVNVCAELRRPRRERDPAPRGPR